MKKLLLILLVMGLPLMTMAQGENDFSTQYMSLYSDIDSTIVCKTVGPRMMKHMMNLDTVENNDELRTIMKQIKTLQVVRANGEETAEMNYDRAITLAQLNKRRYKLYARGNDYQIYLRKKGNAIVELVHISCQDSTFCIINLTGNMTKNFISRLSKQ